MYDENDLVPLSPYPLLGYFMLSQYIYACTCDGCKVILGHGRRDIAVSRSGIGGVKRHVKTPTAVKSLLQSFLVIKSATFVLDLFSYLILWQIDTKRNFASWLFHINRAIEQEVSDQTM